MAPINQVWSGKGRGVYMELRYCQSHYSVLYMYTRYTSDLSTHYQYMLLS